MLEMETLVQHNFISRVLGWTKDDYNNGNLYKKEIIDIPSRFNSPREYYQSFLFPFYDDLKFMIAREWNAFGKKHEIVGNIDISKVSSTVMGSEIEITCNDIDVTQIYTDDLVLLTMDDSFSMHDSNQNYLTCFVLKKKIIGNSICLKVQTILSENMPEYELLLDQKSKWKMAKISSLTSQIRIYDALSSKVDAGFRILKTIMDPERMYPKINSENLKKLRCKLESIGRQTKSQLNEYQKEAIINAVCISRFRFRSLLLKMGVV